MSASIVRCLAMLLMVVAPMMRFEALSIQTWTHGNKRDQQYASHAMMPGCAPWVSARTLRIVPRPRMTSIMQALFGVASFGMTFGRLSRTGSSSRFPMSACAAADGKAAKQLADKYGFSARQCDTLLSCYSVRIRTRSPSFWLALDRLQTEYRMDAQQLCTFMCNSAAVRLDRRG